MKMKRREKADRWQYFMERQEREGSKGQVTAMRGFATCSLLVKR